MDGGIWVGGCDREEEAYNDRLEIWRFWRISQQQNIDSETWFDLSLHGTLGHKKTLTYPGKQTHNILQSLQSKQQKLRSNPRPSKKELPPPTLILLKHETMPTLNNINSTHKKNKFTIQYNLSIINQ